MNKIASLASGAFAVVTLTLGLGCGGDSVGKLDEFADRMCACKDEACVTKVNEEIIEWLKKNADRAKDPSEADKKRATEAMDRMLACAKKVSSQPASGDEAADEATDAPAGE